MLKKKEERASGAPPWMTTYGDMVTLMLCFFVALFAFSTIDSQKYQQISLSLRAALGGTGGVLSGGPAVFNDTTVMEKTPVEQLYREIRQVVEQGNWKGQVEVTITERGITISFKEKLFFKIGSAQILTEAYPVLKNVGTILKERKYPLRIEGHTCDLPIRTAQFPSNWELSAIRAVNVAKFLIERVGFEPRRISVAGYGEYQPLVPNTSEENRAKNRRVDIVVITGSTRNNAVRAINKPSAEGQRKTGQPSQEGDSNAGRDGQKY